MLGTGGCCSAGLTMAHMTAPDPPERRRSRPPVRWVIAVAAAAVILVIALMALMTVSGAYSIVTCDTWSIDLRDGTILTPPPEAIPSGVSPGDTRYDICWKLPWWVTMDDLATPDLRIPESVAPDSS